MSFGSPHGVSSVRRTDGMRSCSTRCQSHQVQSKGKARLGRRRHWARGELAIDMRKLDVHIAIVHGAYSETIRNHAW